jgi:hypothetical protein
VLSYPPITIYIVIYPVGDCVSFFIHRWFSCSEPRILNMGMLRSSHT